MHGEMNCVFAPKIAIKRIFAMTHNRMQLYKRDNNKGAATQIHPPTRSQQKDADIVAAWVL